MKRLRYILPLVAVVVVAVGAACTPVKQQFGKNVLAYTFGNGCLPTLSDGIVAGDNDKSNGGRLGANQSREVCTNGFAGNQVGPQGVTIQVVNGSVGDATPLGANSGSSAGFVTGGLNALGNIGSLKVTATGGSSNVSVSIVLDKNKDGQFLCPPGSATALCGDAVAPFGTAVSTANGNEYVFDDLEVIGIPAFGIQGVFSEPCAAGPPGCFQNTAGGLTFGELKKGKVAGIGGDTPAVLSFSVSGGDSKATVTGVEVNGKQFLP